MATEKLTVELPEDLYHKLIETVTTKGDRWRTEESFTEALESAVTAALMLFLQTLTGETELPEFREYARLKYPYLNGDLITMMADLIERQKEVAARLKPQTSRAVTPEKAQEIGRREIEEKHPHFFED